MTILPSSDPLPPPQATAVNGRTTASAMAAATRIRKDGISVFPFAGALVVEDLAEEVLGPIRFWIGEELFWCGFFDDRTVGHEDDALRRTAGEAHLMGDHHHRHALFGPRRHYREPLL